MGIFSGLFKSRDKPQNRTTGSNYAFFFGGTTSGKAVTERSAMQMTAVYSCVRILSEAVAGLCISCRRLCKMSARTAAARQWRSTIRSTACSTMSRTRR